MKTVGMEIRKGFKLFEMRDDQKLFPLFIGKNTETPMGEWVMAEIVEKHDGFAHRPGWHIGAYLPSAVWLMSADGTYKSQRGKRFKRVWCEISYVADVDYTNEVLKLPKKCFTDRLPDGGYYEFRESGNRLWIIADRIRVDRILTEEERKQILNDMKYDEQAAFEPNKQAMARRMKIS